MKTVEYNGVLLTGRFIHKRQALFFHKTTGKTFDLGLYKLDDIRYLDLEEEFASLLSMSMSSEVLTKPSKNRKTIDTTKIKDKEVLERLSKSRNKQRNKKQESLRTYDWNVKISSLTKHGMRFAKLDILNRNKIIESPFGGETEFRIYKVKIVESEQCPNNTLYRLSGIFELNNSECIGKAKCWYKKPHSFVINEGTKDEEVITELVSDRFDKKTGRKIAVNNLLNKFPELTNVVYTLYPELNY